MTKTDQPAIEAAVRQLLIAIGEDPTRQGLEDTPARVARYWEEFIAYDPGTVERTFEAISVDQLVMVRNVPIWSLCEHHLLPFSATVTMGYLTNEQVLGLSKFARVAHEAAHKLQLQERLASDIAIRLQTLCDTENVAVVATGKHLCMSMRGIQSDGDMVTSSMHGRFRESGELRQEFLSLGGKSNG